MATIADVKTETGARECPWCRRSVITVHHDDQRDDWRVFFGGCDKCGAQGPAIFGAVPNFRSTDEYDLWTSRRMEEALVKWNRRPDTAQMIAALEDIATVAKRAMGGPPRMLPDFELILERATSALSPAKAEGADA